MRFRITSFFLAAAMLNALAKEGLTSANYASVSTGGGTVKSKVGDFASALAPFDGRSGVGISGLGFATASSGMVLVYARADAEGVSGMNTGLGVASHADSVFDDIIISAPSTTATSVNTTVFFNLEGSLATGGSHGGVASAEVSIRVGDGFAHGALISDSTPGGFQSATGIFAGRDGATAGGFDIAVTGNIPVGVTTVFISLEVTANASQNGSPPGLASFAQSDFSHTLSFARDRPVFDLPEGWTVNSVSANIVNNYWVPPVPEPSSALLGLVAAAGWSALAIRRKRG